MIKVIIKQVVVICLLTVSMVNSFSQVEATVLHIEHYPDGTTDLGEIYLDFIGGTPPYQILWDDNSSAGYRENLQQGTYCVSITDDYCCNLGNHCFDILDCGNVSSYNPLSVEINCTVTQTCPVQGEAVIEITGGSGNYYKANGDLYDNSIITLDFGVGTHEFYVQDACTGESIGKCFKARNGSANIENINCEYPEDTNNDYIETARLGVYPSVYENQTTLEIDLNEATVVKVKSTNIYGGNINEIIQATYLPAGRHYIPVNTVQDALGVNVFILETECIQYAQPAFKVGP